MAFTGPDRPATDTPCAVVDCPNDGRPQICMYDGRYHHHGCIHYDRIAVPSALTFRSDGWHWICHGHYAILKDELEQRRADRVRDQLSKALLG